MSGRSESSCNRESNSTNDIIVNGPLATSVCNMQPKEIFTEFKNLYEGRIKRIEQESPDNSELKLAVLEEWVKELMNQNAMLIDVATELEKEACERVSLLEKRLKCSARAARESMLRLQDTEPKSSEASDERGKTQTSSPKAASDSGLSEQEQILLKQEVIGLKCDVATLIQLMRRGASTGRWSTSDLVFYETSQDELQSTLKEIEREAQVRKERESSEDCPRNKELTETNRVLEHEIIEKDSIIARLETELTQLSQELSLCESAQAINNLGAFISDTSEKNTSKLEMIIQRLKEENDRQKIVIARLHEEIIEKKSIIGKFKSHIAELEKASRETRDVLTNEVAEKHDQILALRGEIEKLEESLHKACMQTRFKDDIIKEMRQEIRCSRAKVAALESEIESRNLERSTASISRIQLNQNTSHNFPAEKPEYPTRTQTPHGDSLRHGDAYEVSPGSPLSSVCSRGN